MEALGAFNERLAVTSEQASARPVIPQQYGVLCWRNRSADVEELRSRWRPIGPR